MRKIAFAVVFSVLKYLPTTVRHYSSWFFLKAYECLQSGIGEWKQNIQRDKQKILRGVREIRQRHRASAENQVHDQHREEPDAIDEPAVDIPCRDLHDGVDDHVQRDVALVDDLPIVHAVHEDRLEAQAEEQRH